MRIFFIWILIILINHFSYSNGNEKDTAKYFNWFNLDLYNNKVPGLSTDKAYDEILSKKTSVPVIVAVIDGGVDINHEDLKGKIWVNEGEIPDNGIDDDQNGFVDDIHGWNFLGGPDGKSINQETYEVTRIYKEYKNKFENYSPSNKDELAEYKLYKRAKKIYLEKFTKAEKELEFIVKFEQNYNKADSIASEILKKQDYTTDDLKRIDESGSTDAQMAKSVLIRLYEKGFTREMLTEYKDYYETKVNYHFNLDYNPRGIINENLKSADDSHYGNNDVISVTPQHGTFVSGIIAADRNNNIGMKGIADNAKIMTIRAVPDGDERDKDVANAILYAVNNGAQVINMSFGKDFSPQKKLVDKALKYAENKDVILVHAAGNESQNIDKQPRYPSVFSENKEILNTKWINVGASSIEFNESLASSFSNFGYKSVDIFAPGSDIYSTSPGNKYEILDGTSFASPMVAGVSALLKSYYPDLSSKQIKEIMLSSYVDCKELVVNKPVKNKGKKIKKVKFAKLSATGGLVNVYKAVVTAEGLSKQNIKN